MANSQEHLKEMNIGYGVHRGTPRCMSLICRIILTLLRAMLGVILLADVSLKPSYHEIENFPILQAGLTPMNTSLVNDPNFQLIATGNFWWHFPSMMSYGHSIAPVSCSGTLCQAFWSPGTMSLVRFPAGAATITNETPRRHNFHPKRCPRVSLSY